MADKAATTPFESTTHVNIAVDQPSRLILFSHELPSGDVQDLLRRLHSHAKLPCCFHLSRFLQECASVLKQEVRKLPRPLRDLVPPFNDIITLASHWEQLKESPLRGTWEGAFLCIYEVAMLIGHHEANCIPYSHGTEGGFGATCLAGISVGLFSAAAAAVSNSLTDLVSYGAESVRVAFAFCVHVGRVSQFLETTGRVEAAASNASWAHVVIGVPPDVVQAELDQFNGRPEEGTRDMTTPLTKVSISHVDRASVGVTGPPTRLIQLFDQSRVLGSSRHSSLPIWGGLCHVPNVYDFKDVRTILETAQVWENWGSGRVYVPLISPYTGAPFFAADAYHLIEAICTEALTKPLYFDKLAEGAVAQISNNQEQTTVSSCHVFHYRTSLISENIISDVTDKMRLTSVHRRDLLSWAMQNGKNFDQLHNNPRLPQNSKLAVVGMACRMPGGADTPDQFWELMINGADTHTVVPPDRFDVDAHFDPSGETENAIGTRFGNFIDNPGYFDAGFFNMSPREAEQTDPMQRLALVTAYEALEMAGFVPNRTPSSHVSRVGTYYGQASDDYREVNASQKVGTYGIPGTERAFGNGRINYFFNFQGPSFNVDTACSSGLAAVHAACSALWAGDADTVIAGGLNVITSPDIYCMLTKGHFLSKTGQCKVWDEGADGYCRADGIGSVVIKRLEDALEDNDVVLATIVAGATNHSAESISITQPHAGVQKDNYRQVLNQAGVSPLDVNFVELHGTGTQVGDAVESESVLDFFAPRGRRQRPEQRLYLGAVKSNIGHGEAAAGIASLIKVLLMYRYGTIPRHVGIKTAINPVVARHLADRNAGVLSENSPWLPISNHRKRYSIVNSFGAHGGNTTLLLEDAREPHIEEANDNSSVRTAHCEVVCISAKSKSSLRGNVNALLRYLDTHKETRLKDLAYTTCARRIHHHIRIATSVSSNAQLRDFLQAAAGDIDTHAKHVSTVKKRVVVFAFSGQGCFHPGAAARLYERAPLFSQQVLELDRIVRQLGFPSVLMAIAGDAANVDIASPTQTYSSTDSETGHKAVISIDSTSTTSRDIAVESPLVTQLALVVLQIALVQYWRALGITPGVVIGHSLGEYAAFVASDVLSVADALFLVGKRAELMLAACHPKSHAMLSVRGASVTRIEELCQDSKNEYHYQVSCVNGRTDIVVSGSQADMASLRGMLQDAGLKCVILDVPFAFHSSQLEPILEDFENEARRITFKQPAIPVISPLLGQCVSKDQIINETYLRRATREPVNFVQALDAAVAEGVVDDTASWIDIGPHPVCTSFVRNHYGIPATQIIPSMRKGDGTLSALSGSLAALHCQGFPVAWNEYFVAHEKSHRLLHLESYQWNQKNYWIPYEGNWTLNKAHAGLVRNEKTPVTPAFFTSSVQQIISEEFDASVGRIAALTNLANPDLIRSAGGHKINGRSVVTGSTWADLTMTIGEYLYKRMVPGGDDLYMDVRNMEVFEAQVLHEDVSHASRPAQFIRVEGVLHISQRQTQVCLFSANEDGTRKTDRAFATAMVCYEDARIWQAEWQIASHLVMTRANSLWQAAANDDISDKERVSGLSRKAVYQLFANVVDYGAQYRGMQRVALAEDTQEATADIMLDIDRHGTWHTPPHWIDSTFQLAGFVMNAFGVQGEGETAGSSRDFFYITPGWRHLRLAERLEPGPKVKYRNYVRMFPVEGEPGAFAGDIYLLRDEKVIGICIGIKFKRVPRALMPLMFPRHQAGKSNSHGVFAANTNTSTTSHSQRAPTAAVISSEPQLSTPHTFPILRTRQQDQTVIGQTKEPNTPPSPSEVTRKGEAEDGQSPRVAACLRLVADETGLDLEDLVAEAAFADLGVDSLMSLALAGKIRAELGIDVQASIFLECTTVQDLVNWLGK